MEFCIKKGFDVIMFVLVKGLIKGLNLNCSYYVLDTSDYSVDSVDIVDIKKCQFDIVGLSNNKYENYDKKALIGRVIRLSDDVILNLKDCFQIWQRGYLYTVEKTSIYKIELVYAEKLGFGCRYKDDILSYRETYFMFNAIDNASNIKDTLKISKESYLRSIVLK